MPNDWAEIEERRKYVNIAMLARTEDEIFIAKAALLKYDIGLISPAGPNEVEEIRNSLDTLLTVLLEYFNPSWKTTYEPDQKNAGRDNRPAFERTASRPIGATPGDRISEKEISASSTTKPSS